jgi:hypothetical protein
MKISLDEVSEHLDGYHQYANYGMALCPFHNDNNPSLMVWDRGFKCLSCGEHGSLNFLYEKVSGRIVIKEKVYNPSAKIWDKWLGIFYSIPNIAKVAHNNLLNTPDLAHYLITRKIDSQIRNGMFGYLDGWYTFPVRDEFGQVQGIVARASPTIQTVNVRYSVSPTCPIKLYIPDWKAIKNAEEIYVVFGTLDAWSMTMAGYPCVTGLSGQGLNSEHLTMRKKHWILPDWGEWQSGLNLQYDMGWRATNIMLDYPDGCKDLNEVHIKYGIDKILELIKNVRRCNPYQKEGTNENT